jgi:hypothetical protein
MATPSRFGGKDEPGVRSHFLGFGFGGEGFVPLPKNKKEMANSAVFDLGSGNGIQQASQGGTAKLSLTIGSPTAATQVKFTGPTSPGGSSGSGPALLSKFVNGITAQTNTLTLYDAGTAGACVPANAIYTIATPAANAIINLDLPVINGLFYSASGAFAGPCQLYFS